EKLYELNPGLKENGLKIDQILIISNASSTTLPSSAVTSSEVYEVKPGDTIYSIAMRNNITVSELYESNPGLEKSTLQSGQLLVIPKKDTYARHSTPNNATSSWIELKVAPKQTMYNIQKTYGVTDHQLKEWNPQLVDGLKEGM